MVKSSSVIVVVGFSEHTHIGGRSVGANINQDRLQVGKDVFFGHVELCGRENWNKTLQPNKIYVILYFMFLLVSCVLNVLILTFCDLKFVQFLLWYLFCL